MMFAITRVRAREASVRSGRRRSGMRPRLCSSRCRSATCANTGARACSRTCLRRQCAARQRRAQRTPSHTSARRLRIGGGSACERSMMSMRRSTASTALWGRDTSGQKNSAARICSGGVYGACGFRFLRSFTSPASLGVRGRSPRRLPFASGGVWRLRLQVLRSFTSPASLGVQGPQPPEASIRERRRVRRERKALRGKAFLAGTAGRTEGAGGS